MSESVPERVTAIVPANVTGQKTFHLLSTAYPQVYPLNKAGYPQSIKRKTSQPFLTHPKE